MEVLVKQARSLESDVESQIEQLNSIASSIAPNTLEWASDAYPERHIQTKLERKLGRLQNTA